MEDKEQDIFRFKIEGDLGKFQTLPIETLIEIAQNFQKLILAIVETDINSDFIDYKNFKIELTDFSKGSSVPAFEFTKRLSNQIDGEINNQKRKVAEKINSIFEMSSKGDFSKFYEMYPDTNRRNKIVESYYNFSSSFKSSPVSVVKKSNNENFESIYKLIKFNKSAKDSLIGVVKKEDIEFNEEKVIAEVKLRKGRKTIEKTYTKEKHSLSFCPEIIVFEDKKYILKYPLRSLFEKEENGYVIKNELLNITAYGQTEEEVEYDFSQDFDYLYQKLISTPDEKLSKRLCNIKLILIAIVKEVLE